MAHKNFYFVEEQDKMDETLFLSFNKAMNHLRSQRKCAGLYRVSHDSDGVPMETLIAEKWVTTDSNGNRQEHIMKFNRIEKA